MMSNTFTIFLGNLASWVVISYLDVVMLYSHLLLDLDQWNGVNTFTSEDADTDVTLPLRTFNELISLTP